MTAVIETVDLVKKYRVGSEIITALNGVNLKVARGEFLCILGTSGSGKTTLLNVASGLERPTSGKISLGGIPLHQVPEKEMAAIRRRYLGFVFQSYNLIPSLTSLENVTLPLVFAGVPPAERERRGKELLIRLGLGDRMQNKPTELSGGQQQRVSIARALINNPRVIFADEPTGNLDTRTTHDIMRLFVETIAEKGQTLVMVSHDEEVAAYAHRVIRMRDGSIIETTVKGE
ncbi:MAG: ABC transporter ATP-binding protein [bacterium]|nr:ABC transporter ATP-binding protein [Bacillota bacterium]HHW54534.1 ABC transporter ATP-binding protein [Bacillota bacterium]